MIERPFWAKLIDKAWSRAPVVWLTGVRRVGKTTLARSFGDALYLNCDLPSVAQQLQDPENFFKSQTHTKIVLDEVHQLPDPSRLLKIGADSFPHLKILATGSSTLSATQKFRDSLTGRKRVVRLLPVMAEELSTFGVVDVKQRLLRGGLPQALLFIDNDPEFYAEWMDSFYARDVQELFRVEKRSGFLMLLEVLLRQSSGLAEITTLSKLTGLTRPTVTNYLQVLQITHAITILRPFSGGGRREIIAQPKIYGFDTGFVAYTRSWNDLRNEDCGPLWEHLVLETLLTIVSESDIHFWRDKQQREIDFVITRGRAICHVIECKWRSDALEMRSIKAFREAYPKGINILCSPQIAQMHSRSVDGIEVTFASATDLRELLSSNGDNSSP